MIGTPIMDSPMMVGDDSVVYVPQEATVVVSMLRLDVRMCVLFVETIVGRDSVESRDSTDACNSS